MMAALLILLYVAAVIVSLYIIQHGDSGEMPGIFLNISAERAKPAQISKYPARRLSQEDRTGFLRAWQTIRARFEYDPRAAIVYADLLAADLLEGGFLSQNLSAKHGFHNCTIDDSYQAAHAIAKPGSARIIGFSELERAMELYSSLFEEVVVKSSRDANDLKECGGRSKERIPA